MAGVHLVRSCLVISRVKPLASGLEIREYDRTDMFRHAPQEGGTFGWSGSSRRPQSVYAFSGTGKEGRVEVGNARFLS